jgi:hypothetical protein
VGLEWGRAFLGWRSRRSVLERTYLYPPSWHGDYRRGGHGECRSGYVCGTLMPTRQRRKGLASRCWLGCQGSLSSPAISPAIALPFLFSLALSCWNLLPLSQSRAPHELRCRISPRISSDLAGTWNTHCLLSLFVCGSLGSASAVGFGFGASHAAGSDSSIALERAIELRQRPARGHGIGFRSLGTASVDRGRTSPSGAAYQTGKKTGMDVRTHMLR